MAIYHLEAKVISRGTECSAVAATGYICCSGGVFIPLINSKCCKRKNGPEGMTASPPGRCAHSNIHDTFRLKHKTSLI